MKKQVWFIAALTALALVFAACGSASDDPPEKTKESGSAEGLFISTTEGGSPVSGGGKSVTTTSANQNIYVYFDAPGRSFDKIVFDFTLAPGSNFTVTAIYGKSAGDQATWGKQTWDTDYYESGPLDILTTAFTADWSGTGDNGINKATMFGFCVSIATSGTAFTVTDVTFVGLEEAADKTELIELLGLIEEYVIPLADQYTPATWAVFAEKYNEAIAIKDKSGASVQEIADIIEALYEAYYDLEPLNPPDKTDLNALIADAEDIEQGKYTQDSWNNFTRALDNAKDVSARGNALQGEVDSAIDWLEDAIDGLEEIQESDLPPSFWTFDNAPAASTTATLIVSDYVSFANDVITVLPNPNASGEFRVHLFFDPPVNVSTVQGVLFATDGVEASFNITYKSASDETHNNWGSDSGSWGLWGGIQEESWDAYVGATDKTVAFIELYSGDAFEDQNSVEISGFNFQVGPVYDPDAEFDPVDFDFTLTNVELISGGSATTATGWYLADGEGGSAASGNKATLNFTEAGDKQDVFLYFTASGSAYDSIRLTFTTTSGTSITVNENRLVYTGEAWGKGYGGITSPATIDLSEYSCWYSEDQNPVLDATKITGVVLSISS